MTPSGGSPWSAPGTVAGFAQAAPNAVLMRYALERLSRSAHGRVLDLGCGAGRNAVPLAQSGWQVTGIDSSRPMLEGAAQRARHAGLEQRLGLALATMERLPVRERSFDLVIAHGIWNLARSAAEFRSAVREAARAARPGAGLFVFTFSRHTLPPEAEPVAGEPFVFTQFSGQPQCFLTEQQLVAEMQAAGFLRPAGEPVTEYNRPQGDALRLGGGPVIYEATFTFAG